MKEKISDIEFDGNKLKKLLINETWMENCHLIEKDGELKVFCSEYDCYLRYSKGPKQGYFWDVYGDKFLYKELALYALSQAPLPFRPYIKYTLNLNPQKVI